jgi:hypothetical protein
MTFERPLRISSMRASRPALSTPISADTTKMPPMVMAKLVSRKGQLPASPPRAPASMARMSAYHSVSTKLLSATSSGMMPKAMTTMAYTTIIRNVTTASQAIRARVPLAMELSKA